MTDVDHARFMAAGWKRLAKEQAVELNTWVHESHRAWGEIGIRRKEATVKAAVRRCGAEGAPNIGQAGRRPGG